MTRFGFCTATLLAVAVIGSASAQNITYLVDCSKGQTIGAALGRNPTGQPVNLLIRGTCNEYVAIARDDVTLTGVAGTGATVNGPGSEAPAIFIRGDRTAITDLTVTGGKDGVAIDGAFAATLTRVEVRNPAQGGAVMVRGGGDLALVSCKLTQAGVGLRLARAGSARVATGTEISDNVAEGILADLNSTVIVSGGSKILRNGSSGIQLYNGSQADINASEVSGNRNGVIATTSGLNVTAGSVIRNNLENGVFGYLGSAIVLNGSEVAYNGTGVACRFGCTMQISGANLHDNTTHAAVVMLGSKAIFTDPMTHATGNGWVDLWCGDPESSVDGVNGLSYDGGVFFDGNVDPACTGF